MPIHRGPSTQQLRFLTPHPTVDDRNSAGPKYADYPATIPKVLVYKVMHNRINGTILGDQKPPMLGTWTLWECFETSKLERHGTPSKNAAVKKTPNPSGPTYPNTG